MDRKTYTDEFKREAVRLAAERGNLAQVARDLGINDTMLQRWKKRLETALENEKSFPGHGNPKDPEMAQLKRELARLQEENEILKKLWVSSLSARSEIPVCQRAARAFFGRGAVPCAGGICEWLLCLAQACFEPTQPRRKAIAGTDWGRASA